MLFEKDGRTPDLYEVFDESARHYLADLPDVAARVPELVYR